ncbi:hypothetical protein QJS04_geneDACA020237 [Acorus gramineus]|uniref:Vomeronasal type-1 receptor n=1 Tax=Acorus gramineus TaxID=55184 RepID=A0AAV9A3Z3_ACOGR|nr:hypothetical protein QJS04_geneDACA020237 [Acorus gramineus]
MGQKEQIFFIIVLLTNLGNSLLVLRIMHGTMVPLERKHVSLPRVILLHKIYFICQILMSII